MISTREVPAGLSEEIISDHMSSFLGDQYQTPPMFSAKKVDGVPFTKWHEKERPWSGNLALFESTNLSLPIGLHLAEVFTWNAVRGHMLERSCMIWGKNLNVGLI